MLEEGGIRGNPQTPTSIKSERKPLKDPGETAATKITKTHRNPPKLWVMLGVKQKLILLLLAPYGGGATATATAPVILLLAKRLTTEIHCRTPQHVAKRESEPEVGAVPTKKLYTKLGN